MFLLRVLQRKLYHHLFIFRRCLLIEQLLLTGKSKYLLLLGADRDNEVLASHPLAISLKKLKQNKAVINKIKLKNLPIYQKQ